MLRLKETQSYPRTPAVVGGKRTTLSRGKLKSKTCRYKSDSVYGCCYIKRAHTAVNEIRTDGKATMAPVMMFAGYYNA